MRLLGTYEKRDPLTKKHFRARSHEKGRPIAKAKSGKKCGRGKKRTSRVRILKKRGTPLLHKFPTLGGG